MSATEEEKSVEDQLKELKEAYDMQSSILANVVLQQRNVDTSLFAAVRKPTKLPGVVKEFAAVEKLRFDVKKEANELAGGESSMRMLEKYVLGNLARRLEYLYTVDTYGDRAGAHFLIIADGETDAKKLIKLSAEAAKMTASAPRTAYSRPHKRLDNHSGHGKRERAFCTMCNKPGHTNDHCWTNPEKGRGK